MNCHLSITLITIFCSHQNTPFLTVLVWFHILKHFQSLCFYLLLYFSTQPVPIFMNRWKIANYLHQRIQKTQRIFTWPLVRTKLLCCPFWMTFPHFLFHFLENILMYHLTVVDLEISLFAEVSISFSCFNFAFFKLPPVYRIYKFHICITADPSLILLSYKLSFNSKIIFTFLHCKQLVQNKTAG